MGADLTFYPHTTAESELAAERAKRIEAERERDEVRMHAARLLTKVESLEARIAELTKPKAKTRRRK